MWTSHAIRFVATTILLGSMVIICGCRRQSASEESEQTQQARARADREALLEYLKKDGQVDWRKRIDAASQALDEAKSDRRWGRSDKALEHALQAAQLLPPPGKDFDAPSSQSGGQGERSANANAGEESPETGELPAGDELLAEQGDSVSSEEVQQLRESLESLLESLDGKAGRAKSGLSFQRDAIEIR
jgi:hypothetical protein